MKAMWSYLDRSRAKLLWSAGCVVAGLIMIFSRTAVTCVQSAVADTTTSVPGTVQLGLVWGCAAIAAVVVCVLLYSVLTYPAREHSEVRRFHALGEFCWALVPVIILFGMAAPAVGDLVAGKNSDAQQTAAAAAYRCMLSHE